MRRFARAWDLVANSGRFPRTVALLLARHPSPDGPSAFQAFAAFTRFVADEVGPIVGIALPRLAELLFLHLTSGARGGVDVVRVATALLEDYVGSGERRAPPFLLEHPHVPADLKRRFQSLGSRLGAARPGIGTGATAATKAQPSRQGRHHPAPASGVEPS
jgi:hypothetical protein